jgi:hypothetical protein
LLCPEPRLRRILRIALAADGFSVLEWNDPTALLTSPVTGVVADLDSLRWQPSAARAHISQLGVECALPLLLICIQPAPPDLGDGTGSASPALLQSRVPAGVGASPVVLAQRATRRRLDAQRQR